MSAVSAAFLSTPPCAELHLHIEGTLEPAMVLALAEKHGITPAAPDVDAFAALYDFTDLSHFLSLYYANTDVLRDAEDFADLTLAYLRRAADGGVMHAEIMFDPQAHLSRGIPLAAVVEGISAGLADGERELGVTTGLIAAFLRDRPAAEADAVLTELLDVEAPLLGIGLDSAEVGFPPVLFRDLFARAASLGLHRVAHAGEEGPPEYVTGALDLLGAERIDHGIRSVEDSRLVVRLAEQRVPLTVCPLSNVRLRAVDSLAAHPLVEMMRRGLVVTVNSDDPAYFGGYVDDNYAALAAQFGLARDDLATLALNSVEASFASPDRKSAMRAVVEEWRTAQV